MTALEKEISTAEYNRKQALAQKYLDKINFNWLSLNVPANLIEKMEDILMRHCKQDFLAGYDYRKQEVKQDNKKFYFEFKKWLADNSYYKLNDEWKNDNTSDTFTEEQLLDEFLTTQL